MVVVDFALGVHPLLRRFPLVNCNDGDDGGDGNDDDHDDHGDDDDDDFRHLCLVALISMENAMTATQIQRKPARR